MVARSKIGLATAVLLLAAGRVSPSDDTGTVAGAIDDYESVLRNQTVLEGKPGSADNQPSWKMGQGEAASGEGGWSEVSPYAPEQMQEEAFGGSVVGNGEGSDAREAGGDEGDEGESDGGESNEAEGGEGEGDEAGSGPDGSGDEEEQAAGGEAEEGGEAPERTAALARAAELFSRPLSRKEYYERNWMWIRCRTWFSNRFDAGGSWFGLNGEDFKGELERETYERGCGVLNYKAEYRNGRDWGDASISFDWFSVGCTQTMAVWAARRAAQRHGERFMRDFYIWNCPGHTDYPNFGIETGPGAPGNPKGGSKTAPIPTPYMFNGPYGDTGS